MKKCGVCGNKITGECYKDNAGDFYHIKCVKAKSIVIAKETEDAKKIKASKIPHGFEDFILRKNTIGEINAKKDGTIGT